MTIEETKTKIPCGKYRHFKGEICDVICIGQHTEDEEPMVVYRSCQTGDIWVRPAEMWLERVDTPEGKVQRFTLVQRGSTGDLLE